MYGGVQARIDRLGLAPLVAEIEEIITAFELRVKEAVDANGAAAVRKLIDQRFHDAGGWKKTQTGGVDWIKCKVVNGTQVCVGVEVQLSARSDLLVMDICHLRDAISVDAKIDIGVIVVADDTLADFLTDRIPRFTDAIRHVRAARAEDFPLLILGIRHDGPGEPLAKQKKKKMLDED